MKFLIKFIICFHQQQSINRLTESKKKKKKNQRCLEIICPFYVAFKKINANYACVPMKANLN